MNPDKLQRKSKHTEHGGHVEYDGQEFVASSGDATTNETSKTAGRRRFNQAPHEFVKSTDDSGQDGSSANETSKTAGRRRFNQAPHEFATVEHMQDRVSQVQADQLLAADEPKPGERELTKTEKKAQELQKQIAKALKELFEKIQLQFRDVKKVNAEQVAGELHRDESLLDSVSVLEKYLNKNEMKGIIKTAVEQRTADLSMFKQTLKKYHIEQLIKIKQIIDLESKD